MICESLVQTDKSAPDFKDSATTCVESREAAVRMVYACDRECVCCVCGGVMFLVRCAEQKKNLKN